MKTERAIELLNRLQDEQFDGIHGDERREALSMAVRALEPNLVKESGDLVQDLVNDCISRKMAIDAFVKYVADGYAESPNDFEGYMGIVKKLPSAQPERKNGHWVEIGDEPYDEWECDVCGFAIDGSGCIDPEEYRDVYRFCPRCGADMRGDSDGNN